MVYLPNYEVYCYCPECQEEWKTIVKSLEDEVLCFACQNKADIKFENYVKINGELKPIEFDINTINLKEFEKLKEQLEKRKE